MKTKQSIFLVISILTLLFFTKNLKAQTPYASYNQWITNGEVLTMAEDTNYVYIGGYFPYIGPPTGSGAKITTSNTNPNLTYCRPNGYIYVVISDSVGGWFIGGNFNIITTSSTTAVPRNNIAHIFANGQLDMAWNPAANGDVNALVLSGSDLFVGGNFTNIGGQTRNNLAKLNATGIGTVDATWNPGANYLVTDMAISGTDLYVCGNFTGIGGAWRNYIAKLTTTGAGLADVLWNPNPVGGINAIAISGTDLYVGGSFTNISGQLRNNIAKLSTLGNGAANATWNPNPNGAVHVITISGSDVYVGGVFTNIGGQSRANLAKLSTMGSGTADAVWDPNLYPSSSLSNRVLAITTAGSDVYVSGGFSNIGGLAINNIARLSATGTGAADATWNPNPEYLTGTIAISGSDIYVGGQFTSIGGVNRTGIARFNKLTGGFDFNWNPHASDAVVSIAVSSTDLYAAGTYSAIGGLIRNGIAKISLTGSGLADPAWTPTITSSAIKSIALSGSDLYIAGSLVSVNGQPRNYIAKISAIGTGTLDLTWNPNSSNTINFITLSGTDLYACGTFTNIGGQPRNKVAKLSTLGTGAADINWNPILNGTVNTITVSGTDVFLGGGFTLVNGQSRNKIAKLSSIGSGTLDAIWNPNAFGGDIYSLAIAGNDLYVGGAFTTISSQSRNGIAKLNPAGTGTASAFWNPNAFVGNGVKSIVISGTNLYLGGQFVTIGNVQRQNFAVLETCALPTLPALLANSNSICIGGGDSLSIVGGSLNEATNWNWYDAGCGLNPVGTGTIVNASPSVTTTYYVRGEGGCASAANCASITVTVNSSPTIAISASSSTLCNGSAATFAASGANTYTWNTGATSPTLNITPTLNTTYTCIGTSACGTDTQTISVIVDNTCQDVWPGDANSDGVADNLDVLELGLHYTQSGTPRATTSNLWQSYYSSNWSGTITNGKNVNHSNCNGDGIINDDDTLAIFNNYSLTHAFKPEQTTTNPVLTIVPDQSSVAKGIWGTSSIYLGDASTSISNINGVAFTVTYDNTLLETDSVWIEYPTSFINASNQNLKFRKRDFSNGKLYTATTHTISGNVNGYGKIAILHYKIKSSLTTDNVLNLSIAQANQSDSSGVITPLTAGSATLMALGTSITTNLNALTNGNYISLHPNPTNGALIVNSTTELQKIEVMAITGQLLMSEVPSSTSQVLHLDHLANGVYFVNLYQNNRIVKREKIILNK